MSTPNPEPAEKTRWGLLLAGLAVTAVIIWFEWFGAPANEADVIGPAERSSLAANQRPTARDFVADITSHGIDAAVNPVSTMKRPLLRDTLERPLFAMSRRQPVAPPPTIVEPPPPPPPPDPGDLTLIGVMVGGDSAVALLRIKGRADTLSVRDGEIIDGWTIKRITPRGMDVTNADVAATIPVSSGKSRTSGQALDPPVYNGASDGQNDSQGENPEGSESEPADEGSLQQPSDDESNPHTPRRSSQSEQ